MRPKKVILCVDDNEDDCSVLKFVLSTNGYRVLSASSGAAAIGLFGEGSVDLVIAAIAMDEMTGNELFRRLKSMAPWIPMVLMGDPSGLGIHAADAVLDKKQCSALEMLECFKLKCARKRGPRKGSQHKPVPSPQPAPVSGVA
jgi:CheY-like chemotaxis protein